MPVFMMPVFIWNRIFCRGSGGCPRNGCTWSHFRRRRLRDFRLREVCILGFVRAEPELAVFHDLSHERDQQQDEREHQPAGLFAVDRCLRLQGAGRFWFQL